jgi:ataxia telangiectasia mutated family protein
MGGARGSNSASRSGIPRALKNHLNVVTYSIVPLSPTSGVLEWAKDTKPFGDIVKTGVHSRYYPGEWTYGKCKDLMVNAMTATQKRKQFDEICKNITPAFRFFFAERFRHSLPQWYAAKMKYTRSCAVSSMVGHVLGIGDRHMHNILIRETTGEVVHIDFGIVFEQGKVSSCAHVRAF